MFERFVNYKICTKYIQDIYKIFFGNLCKVSPKLKSCNSNLMLANSFNVHMNIPGHLSGISL